jgi:phage anti-repressor protein
VKIGDLVQFIDGKGRYSRWFYSQMGEVVNVSKNDYCRVKWLSPVRYHDSFAAVSDFKIDKFEIIG